MHKTGFAVLGIGVLAALGPSAVRADTMWEVEHARANARAGGPISESDAELLERYGCLSGTNNPFCDNLNKGGKPKYRTQQKRVRRY